MGEISINENENENEKYHRLRHRSPLRRTGAAVGGAGGEGAAGHGVSAISYQAWEVLEIV